MAFEEGVNQIKTQKWMEIIESKNQKGHKLAHDLGAGSPCLQCKEACPGLDLHFWRKVCKNCRCKKESHDVKEEDDISTKFEILFGSSKCVPSHAVLGLKLRFPGDEEEVGRGGGGGGSSYPKKEYTFDWVPPNVSPELAAEYMQQLPAAKLPISGSDGALYRRQQMEKQMPLHDLNANLCHNLTSDEVKCLSDYLENLKQNVVGQGKIMKLPSLLSGDDSLHASLNTAPPNVCSMPTSFSADSISNIYNTVPKPFKLGGASDRINQELEFPPPPPELLEDTPTPAPASFLKPPSAFIKQSRTPSPTSQNQHVYEGVSCEGILGSPPSNQSLPRHNTPDGFSSQGILGNPCANPSLMGHNERRKDSDDGEDENKNVKVGDFIRSLNSRASGGAQSKPFGNRTGNLNNVENHDNINGNIRGNSNTGNSVGLSKFETKPYEPTINSVKIESFNQRDENINAPNRMVTQHLDNNRKQPTGDNKYAGVHGDMNRNVMGNVANVGGHAVNAGGDAFSSGVKVTNLDDYMGDLNLNSNNENLNSNNGNLNSNSKSNLIGSNIHNNNLPILNNKANSESGQNFPYGKHQPNDNCQNFLTKLPSGKSCKQCALPIHSGEVAIYTEKLSDSVLWHPQCFVCTTCNELLVDLTYFQYKGNVYCLRDYAVMLAIPRCHACDELIFVNEYTLAENKTFHVKHFCCFECDRELCNQSYIPVKEERDGEMTSHPYCLDCYYRNFSKTCSTCKRVIDVQDKCIQFNGTHFWHIKAECFACAHCAKYLNNERFMMQFEKPFCSRQCVLDFSSTA